MSYLNRNINNNSNSNTSNLNNLNNNNFFSRDDSNLNRVSNNASSSFGGNYSTSRLNPTMMSNSGTGTGIYNSVNRVDEEVRRQGTFGVSNFTKKVFEEGGNTNVQCRFQTIGSTDKFQNFSLEELRYIDYKIKKNPETLKALQGGNMNMNNINNINNLNNLNNVLNGTSNTSNSTINNNFNNPFNNGLNQNVGVNNNNIANNNNLNDFSRYLAPSSGINNVVNNTSTLRNNLLGSNSVSNTIGTGTPGNSLLLNNNLSNLNNQINQSNNNVMPVSNNVGVFTNPSSNLISNLNSNFRSGNLNNNLNNSMSNVGNINNVNNPNKSIPNFFGPNTNINNNNNINNINPSSNIGFNANPKLTSGTGIGSSNLNTNNLFISKINNNVSTGIAPNVNNFPNNPNQNRIGYNPSNPSTGFINNNNINNNLSNNFYQQGNTNNPFANSNFNNKITSPSNTNTALTNPLQNNQFYSRPLSTSTTNIGVNNPICNNGITFHTGQGQNAIMSNNNNFLNSNMTSGILNSSAKIPFSMGFNSVNNNTNPISNINQGSLSVSNNNLMVPNSFKVPTPSQSSGFIQNTNTTNLNNQFPSNSFSNDRNQFGLPVMGKFTNFYTNNPNNSSCVTFNNPMNMNNMINQQRTMMGVNQVMGGNLNNLNNPNNINKPNNDYLGIKSMCQQVNSQLNPEFQFSKKEVEELFSDNYNLGGKKENEVNYLFKDQYDSTYKKNDNFLDQGRSSNIYNSSNYNNDYSGNSISFSTNNKSKIGLGFKMSNNSNNGYSNGYNSNESNNMPSSFFKINVKSNNNNSNNNVSNNLPRTETKYTYNHLQTTGRKAEEILPFRPPKEDGNQDNNPMTNKTENKNKSYYESPEFFREIERLSNSAYEKSVGPIINKNDNIYPNTAGNKYNFSLSKNNFNNTPSFKPSTNHQSVNKNVMRTGMNTIPEANEEIRETPYNRKILPQNNTNNNNLNQRFENINAIELSPDFHIQSSPFDFTKSQRKKQQVKLMDTGILKLHFIVNYPVKCDFNLNVNKKNKAGVLKEAIQEVLKEKFPREMNYLTPNKVSVFTKHGVLKDNDVLETKEFVNENENLVVLIEENPADNQDENKDENKDENHDENKDENQSDKQSDKQSDNPSFSVGKKLNFSEASSVKNPDDFVLTEKNNLIPSYCPMSTKFKTFPELGELQKMPEEQLKKIKNFEISNDNGKISFAGLTDVTYLNLDELVQIDELLVDVYGKVPPPKRGEKLNKPARVLVYKLESSGENENEYIEFLEGLRKSLEGRNAQFVNYDPKKEVLAFDVENFERVELIK